MSSFKVSQAAFGFVCALVLWTSPSAFAEEACTANSDQSRIEALLKENAELKSRLAGGPSSHPSWPVPRDRFWERKKFRCREYIMNNGGIYFDNTHDGIEVIVDNQWKGELFGGAIVVKSLDRYRNGEVVEKGETIAKFSGKFEVGNTQRVVPQLGCVQEVWEYGQLAYRRSCDEFPEYSTSYEMHLENDLDVSLRLDFTAPIEERFDWIVENSRNVKEWGRSYEQAFLTGKIRRKSGERSYLSEIETSLICEPIQE